MIYTALYEPGTKIVSIRDPKCGLFSPGSVMYFSHMERNMDQQACLVRCKLVVIKRGKTGKPRLDYCAITIPLVWATDTKLQELIEAVANANGVDFNIVVYEPTNEGNANLKYVTDLDFLAFVLSKVMFLNHINKLNNYNFWPKTPNFILNIFKDVIAKSSLDDLTKNMVNTLTTVKARSEVLNELRFLEALLQQQVTLYMGSYKKSYHNCINGCIRPALAGKKPDYYDELVQLTV